MSARLWLVQFAEGPTEALVRTLFRARLAIRLHSAAYRDSSPEDITASTLQLGGTENQRLDFAKELSA
jgi:hypothetical protein